MIRSRTSGDLFWLSFARASNRSTCRRSPTVPFAIRRVPASSSASERPCGWCCSKWSVSRHRTA
ncbi:hypothetical protein N866_12180 [Actinotalea ferrariae CF5-4]|uniref:Uncharacterized protein n=1 Tax=Actinotalea ferrariae CF5-4 TaxID=948458 RepID=A0A021VSM5_9CELL|nr:hypothetical protein N866_12180 [Actinotalea ferrariae CF5-4]